MGLRKAMTAGAVVIAALGSAVANLPTANAADVPATAAQLPTVVPNAAAATGVKSKLTQWYEEDGTWHVGLDHAIDADRAALRTRLGTKTVFFQQDPIHSLAKFTKLPKALKRVRISVQSHDAARPANVEHRASSNAAASAQYPPPPPSAQTYPNRLLDAPPYYGGDRIFREFTYNGDNYVGTCTAATLSNLGALSAGHCDGGVKNTVWQQGFLASNKTLYYTATYGRATKSVFTKGAVDSALLSNAGNGFAARTYTHTDPSSAGYIAPSSDLLDYGSATLAKGSKVCADGAVTQYKCGGTVTAVNTCINVQIELPTRVVQQCGMDTVTSSSPLAIQGDSGGVAILNPSPSGKLRTVGIISAGSGNTLYISGIPYVNKQLGVTEVVGK